MKIKSQRRSKVACYKEKWDHDRNGRHLMEINNNKFAAVVLQTYLQHNIISSPLHGYYYYYFYYIGFVSRSYTLMTQSALQKVS